MAILASLFALLGRFVGKILTTALGWSSLLLFGRVPQSKQILLAGITFGSLAWALAVFGVLAPRVGAFLIAAVPAPAWVETSWLRLAMLAAAVLIPLGVGVASRFMLDAAERPRGRDALVGVLRGYPTTAVLAFVLVFIAVVAAVRRTRSLAKRWNDAHVPVIVRVGGYERVVEDLWAALKEAGMNLERTAAPRVLELPAHLLAAVAGRGVRNLVPARLALLRAAEIEVLVYPSDIAISGKGETVARARAAIATRLTFTAAFLTTSRESQAVEELIESAAGVGDSRTMPPEGARRAAILGEVDERLATSRIPYDEWEVLYRMRLQVERDLARPAASRSGDGEGEGGGAGEETPTRRVARAFSVAAVGLIALDVALGIVEWRSNAGRRARRRPL